MLRSLLALALPASALFGLACSSASDGVSSDTSDFVGAGGGGPAGPTCTATFHWLQKDAYKNTAGRTSALWPPHTTTTLAIACGGEVVRSEVRENHGTKPGEKDANGDVYLVEAASRSFEATRGELEALADAYATCECGTKFLSLNGLTDDGVKDLVANLASYVTQHLVCEGPVDAQGVVDLLAKGDIDAVLAVLPKCTWDGGSSLEGGLDAALEGVVVASQATLASYHVCNNDAALQAALFDAVAAGGKAEACAPDGPLCHGPRWFYEVGK